MAKLQEMKDHELMGWINFVLCSFYLQSKLLILELKDNELFIVEKIGTRYNFVEK